MSAPESNDGFLLRAQRAVFKSGLSMTDKLVLLSLLNHWSASRDTFPGLHRLAEWSSAGRSTVQRTVKRLREEGIISASGKPGGSLVYDLSRLPDLPTRPAAGPVPERDPSRNEITPGPRAGPQPVPERDPKVSIEEIQLSGPSPRARSSTASRPSKPTPPNPHSSGLLTFYVKEFERARGVKPGFFGAEWGRAMKAFGQLADKVGPDRAREVITAALNDAYARRVQPWDLARDANNYLGSRPAPERRRAPYVQGGASGVAVNTSVDF